MHWFRSPRLWIVLLVALALVAGVLRWRMGPLVEVVEVRRADIVQSVVASGRLVTPARVALGSVLVGTVLRLEAREGAVVKAGQVLAVLKSDEQRAAVAQARGALAEAEARLAQLATQSGPVAEEGLHKAEAGLRLARAEAVRTQSLFDKGFFSRSRLDEAQRTLKAAQADHDSAVAQAVANRPQGAEYVLARSRREQSRAALEAAGARLANTEIRAPADGVVLKRLVEAGDVVAQGRQMFEMSVSGETQVSLLVDEKNLAFLQVGQAARVAADAYPGRPVPAEVFYIAPVVDAQRGTVEVKLRVKSPADYLKPDMTVSAEIVAGSKAATLVLPAGAVRDAAGSRPWVLVVRDGRTARQAVRLGLHGEGSVEVLEGLAEGALVVPPSAVAVAEGRRVRADRRTPPPKEKTSAPVEAIR
jgi:HlyD family secretion protein